MRLALLLFFTPLLALAAPGRHWRLVTHDGPIHVFAPPGYSSAQAAVVVYLHGYWMSADAAWEKHRLADQFAKSRLDALFIVPEAARDRRDSVRFPVLEALRLRLLKVGVVLPQGPVLLVGHSGAYRTLAEWLRCSRVEQVILLDGLYGEEAAFEVFARTPDRRLILLGQETQGRGERFTRRLGGVILPALPDQPLPAGVPVIAIAPRLPGGAFLDHEAMVEGGVALPLLLRASGLARLPETP